MAATKAQKKHAKAVYGKNIKRGDIGERRAAGMLRRDGYSVHLTDTHPRGPGDLKASKPGRTRVIQIKRISSRNLATKQAARNRIAGKPFGLRTIPKGLEVWVFDKSNRLYKFTK